MTTYKAAGVDLSVADAVVDRIGDSVRSTWGSGVVTDPGGFAAGIGVPQGMADPIFMMTTDGVGTKIEIARAVGDFSGVGHDLAAMVFDDLAAARARPLAITDYIAAETLDLEVIEEVVASLADACRSAGAALLGGETAEHPGVGHGESLDVSATALGVVERSDLAGQRGPTSGDVIVGLASPNLRSNGFSLVRAVFSDPGSYDARYADTSLSVGAKLIEPSVLYSPAVVRVLPEFELHGLAHITGGGLPSNLARILTPGVSAFIDTSSWVVPDVFEYVAAQGGIAEKEMWRVFNMGIGFAMVCPPGDAESLSAALSEHEPVVIGEIRPGRGDVEIS